MVDKAEFFLGRIVNIDENYNLDREIDVECYDGENKWQESCVVMDPFGHWKGDGITFTPRTGAICVVATIPGFDKPLVIGFTKIPREDGQTGTVNDDPDYQGDYVFKTESGNFIKIHSGGAITLESTPTCNTAYLPSSDTISHLSRIFDIQSDAGRARWENFDDQKKSRFKHWIKRKLGDGAPVFDQVIGYAGDSDEVYITKFGDGLPGGGLSAIASAAGLGKSKGPQINEKLTLTVKKNGSFNIKLKDSGTEFDWDESSKTLDMKIEGEVTSSISKNLTEKIVGEVLTEITKTLMVKVKKQVDIQSERINIGKDALEKMTKGETTQKFLDIFLELTLKHYHGCAVGPTSTPINAPEFIKHKAVELPKILSKKHYNE